MQSQSQNPASGPALTCPSGTSNPDDTLLEGFRHQFEDLLTSHKKHRKLAQSKWSTLNNKETGQYIRRETKTQGSPSTRKVATRDVTKRYLKRNRAVNQAYIKKMQDDPEIGESMRSFRERYAALDWGYAPPRLDDQVFISLGAFDDHPPTPGYLFSVRSARDQVRRDLQSRYREIDTASQGTDEKGRSKLELELQCGELEHQLGRLNSQGYFADRVFQRNPDLQAQIVDGKVVDPSNASATNASAEIHVPDQTEPKASTAVPFSINPDGTMNFPDYPLDPSLDNAGDHAQDASGLCPEYYPSGYFHAWTETRGFQSRQGIPRRDYTTMSGQVLALADLVPEGADEDEEDEGRFERRTRWIGSRRSLYIMTIQS